MSRAVRLRERLPAIGRKKKGPPKGEIFIYFSASSGSSLCRTVWKETKGGGCSGQSTRTKRGHEPGVLVHYAATDQFQHHRNIRTQKVLQTCNARNYHSERPKKKRTEKEVPYATPNVCSRWNAAVLSPWSKWLQMSRGSWLQASGPLA